MHTLNSQLETERDEYLKCRKQSEIEAERQRQEKEKQA